MQTLLTMALVAFMAIVLASIFTWGFYARRPGSGSPAMVVATLFLILFLGLWAASLWIGPVGPVLWGVHWIPLIIVGLILILTYAVTVPQRPRLPRAGEVPHDSRGEPTPRGLALATFWFLLLVLFLSVIAGYLWPWNSGIRIL